MTISEVFFGQAKVKEYKKFLELFLDQEDDDKKFSLIAVNIHRFRDTVAHKWLNAIGHKIDYNYNSNLGRYKENDCIFINPKIYLNQYLATFETQGKIWKYHDFFDEKELDIIKSRIIGQFKSGNN